MEQNFKGPEEAWGLVWQAVGAVMVSDHFPQKLRDQVSQARAAILTATLVSEEYDTTTTVAGKLTFNDIMVGNKYVYDIPAGTFSPLNGRICTIIKKGRTRMETTLDHDWLNFKQGHKLTVYPSHLRRL